MMKKKKKKMMMMIMNNPDKNAKIAKGRISVVLRGRDMKFWERSEKIISCGRETFCRDGQR